MNIKSLIYSLLFTICLMFATSCTPSGEERDTSKPYIVCTTGMIGDGIQNIVGDFATVETLMGPGIDPHSYKAKPSDQQKLMDADIIFYNGLHLEGKMADILEKLSRTKSVIAIADGLEESKLRKAQGEAPDPHIWFDIPLWMGGIQYASNQLQKIYPQQKDFFKAKTEEYLKHLTALHTENVLSIETIPQQQRVLVTAHDAFSYFGARYGIEVKPLKGISTVSETSLKEVTELTDLIVERKINAIFIESSVKPENIEMIAKNCSERGHKVVIGGTLYSDAMGLEGTPEGTYIGMVRANVNTIVNSLTPQL